MNINKTPKDVIKNIKNFKTQADLDKFLALGEGKLTKAYSFDEMEEVSLFDKNIYSNKKTFSFI